MNEVIKLERRKPYNMDGVFVLAPEDMSREEVKNYIDYLETKYERELHSLHIEADNKYADLNYEFKTIPFERIRRITGYLVGTMERWNDAKTAEEHDRIKHGVEMESI